MGIRDPLTARDAPPLTITGHLSGIDPSQFNIFLEVKLGPPKKWFAKSGGFTFGFGRRGTLDPEKPRLPGSLVDRTFRVMPPKTRCGPSFPKNVGRCLVDDVDVDVDYLFYNFG